MTHVLDETKAGTHALSKPQLRECIVAMYREFKALDKCHTMPIPRQWNNIGIAK
jgi:hypothetical protein